MDVQENVAALSAFLGCPLPVAQKLNAKMNLKSFDHKDILVHQGDVNDQIWLILDGNVQLQATDFDGKITMLASQGPGEMFGAFPNQSVSNVDVKCYGKLSVLQISTLDLTELLTEYPSLGKGLAIIFGKQFNAIVERLAMHLTLTAKGRVYAEMLRLSQGHDHIFPSPIIAAVALSAQTTRETASRAINDLIRRGIIERNSEKVDIISRNMLEDLVV